VGVEARKESRIMVMNKNIKKGLLIVNTGGRGILRRIKNDQLSVIGG
jgi:hypothetical protein